MDDLEILVNQQIDNEHHYILLPLWYLFQEFDWLTHCSCYSEWQLDSLV